jgi:uncharacterized SAM-binding protein YcdF (DUF218 family)
MVLGLIIGAVLALCGARRAGAVVAALAVLELAALSWQPVAHALVAPLERQAREAGSAAPACCYTAIVVLGGGIQQAAPPLMPSDDLLEGADRIRYGAQLFRQGIASRIVVSGGNVRSDVSVASGTEAEAMQRFLVELGVPEEAIIKEDRSRNTGENLAFTRKIIGDGSVAIVTSAFHMPRALQLAEREGLKAFAFPTDFRTPIEILSPWQKWLPSIEALNTSHYALWEYLGLLDHRHFKIP